MWVSAWYQLKAIFWKNYLQKKAHFISFLAEILLPVAFMVILIIVKEITMKYDSPNVAYFCGETYPWFYTDTTDLETALNRTGPLQCLSKPTVCTADNYYQKDVTLTLSDDNFRVYRQYGYIPTPNTAGKGSNVFYAFMVGANYNTTKSLPFIENPSLPFCQMLERIQSNNAVLGVAPNNNGVTTATQQFYTYLENYNCDGYNVQKNESLRYFTSESALEDYITNKDYDDEGFQKVAFAYVINSVDQANIKWDYSIRVNYTTEFNTDQPTVACLYGGEECDFRYTIPTTKYYTEDLLKPQLSDYLFGYSYSGFSTLQLLMDQYIFAQYTSTTPDVKVSMSLMPTDDYESDDFQFVISSVLGILFVLAFLYPVSRLIRELVLEKEFRIKEGMKMMGLTDTVYNFSWFLTAFIQMTLIALLITLVTSTTVFEYSNKFYVFVYFEAFGLAIMGMCFLLATFFSRSKTASLIGPMIFFVTFFPYYAVDDPQYDEGSKTATCLLAPACFALGANVFADYEGGLVGVQADNVDQPTSNFTYNACIGMMFLDAFLYGILAFYLDKVFPSEFGTSLPFYFPLIPSYWCGTSGDQHHNVDTNNHSDYDDEDIESIDPKKRQFFEAVPAELKHQIDEEKCISIRKLRKVFKNPAGGDDRVAVDSLNLDMFQNQVTVLLGHNGAGKTTVINMLVGMIPATSGNAFLPGGLDIQHDMAAIRRGLGVCPQHDILFPDLTAFEHLQMFAVFKGVAPSKVTAEANKIIGEVGLREKADSKSSTLSGGQKRKLSLGIALIGDSKVVILDEPTSGMDPFSRRSTWNIIQRNKKGRVILLTTHFMDEADLLGDRVAIMAHGKLQCCGSPLFLKNRFGVGYTLTIVKESQAKVETSRLQRISRTIRELVTSYIPSAEPLSDAGTEQSFRLPFSASTHFVELFQELDARKKKLAISEYGISVMTLEEVFLRVGDMEDTEEAQEKIISSSGRKASLQEELRGEEADGKQVNDEKEAKNNNAEFTSEGKYIAPDDAYRTDYAEFELKNPFWQHFKALFIKRTIYAKRDTRMICCQLILPVIIVIIGLSLLLLQPDFNQPDLVLSPSKYNQDFSYGQRNYVPFLTPAEPCTVCDAMENAFQGVQGSGVWGVAMPVTYDPSVTGDAFGGCAVGAAPLNNVSQYLINTPQADLDQEGGSTIYGTVTLAEGTDTSNLIYNILVNGSALHGAGVYMNLVHQSYLQAITNNPTATITAHNHPLPQTYKQDNQSASIDAFVASLFVMIAFCFIPASFAVFVVKEREVKAKHQQVISGVSIYAYWTSTYVWDTISYLPTAALVIAIMYAYGIDAYTKGSAANAVVALLLLYGPATAGMSYLLSYFFASHSTAQVAVMFFNFITGLCLMVVSFVLSLLNTTQSVSNQIRYVFRLFPSFCLGDGILQLSLCTDGTDCIQLADLDAKPVGPFHMNIAGADIVFLGWQIVVYFGLALLIEYLLTFPSLLSWLYRVNDPGVTSAELVEDDPDVAEERSRVNAGQADSDIIKIHDLRKVYPMGNKAKVAVQSLSFGIPKGECFGFLGINGAGKTTTLSILSGEFPPTSGNAFVDGYSIALDQSKIRRKIGYCPQFDALLELLTVREHLELYGRIKGLEGAALESVVMRKMQQLDLMDFEQKTAGSLSGGNKRKLSVAVATVGDPPIVFLDEPSTGMDPKARRFMWKVIARMSTQDAHCSVILTTHSMEEAEALCTRIGIMVAGRLRCLGSSQHLKHRFGNGYEVNMKLQVPSEESLLQVLQQLLSQTTIRAAPQTNRSSPQNSVRPIKDEELTSELLDRVRIGRDELPSVANALDDKIRIEQIQEVGPGATIHEALEGEGTVTARVFLDWWLSEDIFQGLHRFMETEFDGRAQLLERSGVHSCRYRIQKPQIETWKSPTESEYDSKELLKGATESKSNEEGRNTNDHDYNHHEDSNVDDEGNHLSEIFAKIEAKKQTLQIQEYNVAQTTLEQIFNQFAARQENSETEVSTSGMKSRKLSPQSPTQSKSA